jgi:hypothetical protein
VQRRVANELQAVLLKYYAATAAQGQARLPWPAAACTSSIACIATPLPAPLPAIVRGFLPSDDSELNQIMAAQNMAWFDHNHWRTTFTYLLDADCADSGNSARCGTAFAVLNDALLPPDTTVVGGSGGSRANNTRTMLSFAGVTGAQKTRLAIALQ